MLAALALLVLLPPAGIFLETNGRVHSADDTPDGYECAIVLGASVVNGRLSHMLEDRMKTAVSLYKSGKVIDYLALCGVTPQKSIFSEKNGEGKNSYRRTGDKGASYR